MDPEVSLRELGRNVAKEQDAWLSQRKTLEQAKKGFLERARSAHDQRKLALPRVWGVEGVWVWSAAAAAMVLAAILGFVRPWASAPLVVTAGEAEKRQSPGAWLAAPASEPLVVRVSDGTEIVLEEGTRARLVSVSDRGARLAVESGATHARVAPSADTDYRLSYGPFEVHVTGTRFTANWDPENDELEVVMLEGRVVVSGCVLGEGRPLLAGERLRASCRRREFEVGTNAHAAQREAGEATDQAAPETPPGADRAGAEPAPEKEHVPSPAQPRQPKGSAAPADARERPSASGASPRQTDAKSWQALARSGKYSEAFEAVRAAGIEPLYESLDAPALVTLGDVARFSGHLGHAERAYRSVRRRFSGSPAAARSAFALAQIAFDARGDYPAAARWLRIYLSEQPGGALSREARGRLVEALHRSGDAPGASRQARRYLARYPEGPHADMARKVLGRSR